MSVCVNYQFLKHNKLLAGTGEEEGERRGREGGATEVIYFSPLSLEKLNCNFLRSVLLWSNEAFKLVDGVKLIFKIIVGSKDSQEGRTTRSGFSLLFLFPEFFLGSSSNPEKTASAKSK